MPDAYRIFETDPFQEDVRKLPAPFNAKIPDKLRTYVYPQLRHQPHFGPNIKKLKNWDPDTWRYRIGNWRIFYLIDEKAKTVAVTAIELRRDAY